MPARVTRWSRRWLCPCADVFQPDDLSLLEAPCKQLEGKTKRQKNPHPIGSLPYASSACARLGDWTGYYGKRRGEIPPKMR